jgi:threonine synthase
VPEAALVPAQAFAARHGAGFLSRESAAAFAALPELRSQRAVEPGDTVVVFDTGAGFKSTLPELPSRRSVSANDADWEPSLSGYAPASRAGTTSVRGDGAS